MNVKLHAAAAAAALLLVSAQAGAVTITITFEDLPVNATLSTQYAVYGVIFAPNAFAGANSNSTTQGWATNTNMTVVSSTGGDAPTLGTPALVSGNILRSFNGWLDENGDPSFQATFTTPVSFFSIDFAGVTGSNAAFGDVKIYAYNGATLLGTVPGPASAPAAVSQFTLSFSAPSITRVAIAPGSYADWVGVDNISFVPVPVPEVSTCAMMGLGLALLALKRSTRRG